MVGWQQPQVPSDAALKSTVSDILGFQAQATEANANAQQANASAQGADAQAKAYATAGDIATQNAGLEEMSGRIQQFQEARNVARTMGTQAAGIAGSGFNTSGSALLGLKASYQQGRLADQMISTQTELTRGGFLEQAAAAQGESAAAGFAGVAARALYGADITAATKATASANQETAALMGMILPPGTLPTSLTPAEQLALQPLQGSPGVPNLPPPTWHMGPNGQWTFSSVQGFAQNPGAASGPYTGPDVGLYFNGIGSPGGDWGSLTG